MQRFGIPATEYSTSDLKFLSIHTCEYWDMWHVGYCMQYHESVLHNYFIHQPIYIFVRLHQELCGIYLLLLGRDICVNKDHKPAD